MRWFDQPLAQDVSSLIFKNTGITSCPVTTQISSEFSSWTTVVNTTTPIARSGTATFATDDKFEFIKQQLNNINEKLDIQNSNTPDAVSVSLRTTKKTNVWIFPLDGSEYKKYVFPASDDILKDALNLLFEKSPFALVDTKLDNDGNLTIMIQRVPGTSFGGSAAVEQVKTSIEKTASQFSQIKKVTIVPEEVLQP